MDLHYFGNNKTVTLLRGIKAGVKHEAELDKFT